ncbi:hypothetical protein ON010_g10214 [Phytophthora cinnamomi]|nr:hypothetical protein ON010_g10214 [Phytophthora cinnamomi]
MAGIDSQLQLGNRGTSRIPRCSPGTPNPKVRVPRLAARHTMNILASRLLGTPKSETFALTMVPTKIQVAPHKSSDVPSLATALNPDQRSAERSQLPKSRLGKILFACDP